MLRRVGLLPAALTLLVACGSAAPAAHTSGPASPVTEPSVTATTSTPPVSTAAAPPATTLRPQPSLSSVAGSSSAAAVGVPPANGSTIVIDPGHSPTINSIDPATGLNDSDYENEPEMRDVFAVALLVKAKLQSAGYQVVMTKNSATDRISLGQRAAVANNAHAALAVSIHDQAGASGGIGFNQGNNTVYYQAVGDYRATPNGTKVYFTDAALAATSQAWGQVFAAQRTAAEGHSVKAQGNTGYDLGSRGLAAGNIWIVQLLAKVPWIYNEAGGNSAGQVGLNDSDKQKYADGLVAAIERCVPL